MNSFNSVHTQLSICRIQDSDTQDMWSTVWFRKLGAYARPKAWEFTWNMNVGLLRPPRHL